jgi:cell wall-associated NlpC family hydrolase
VGVALLAAGAVVLALVLLAGAGSHNAKPQARTVGRALAAPAATSAAQGGARSPASGAAGSPASGAARSPASTAARSPAARAAGGKVAEVADPQESSSFPAPASVHHPAAAAPAKAAGDIIAAGAPSDAEVRHELAQMQAVERAAKQAPKAPQLTPVSGGNSIGGNGAIPIPTNAPEVVQRVVAGANAIADFPYVFGGGHASFVDNAYDCSGSVSYALAAGGLLSAPETSGELESWGAPGPGRYITVYAAAGHTYMYVDGIMYNTAGRSGVFASRWQVGSVDNGGFVARHWPGL